MGNGGGGQMVRHGGWHEGGPQDGGSWIDDVLRRRLSRQPWR